MLKSTRQIAAAGLIAGVVIFLTSVAPQANIPGGNAASPQAFAKGDRLPVLTKGAKCSQRAWPNYEQNCLFDNRRSADDVRKVGVVNLDKRDMQPRAPILEVLASR
jgi:hypothetical protein